LLLINAEAKVYLLNPDASNINLLLTRRNQPTVTFTNSSQAMDIIRTTWKSELSREGQRFAKLVQWGKAAEVLGAKGFKNFNGLLPIPQSVLVKNPNLTQNPGF
jgi:hypothetical protein